MATTWCIAALILISGQVLADGKFYAPERLPEIPFQRAVIWHDGAYETVIVQSKYNLGAARDVGEIGWVIPVPAVPEIGTIAKGPADYLFARLDDATRPDVVFLWNWTLLGLVCLVLIRLLLAVIAYATGYEGPYRRFLGTFWGNAGLIGVLMILGVFVLAAPRGALPTPASAPGAKVEVIKTATVGDYEIKVVRSTDASELVDWLRDHQYRFQKSDENAFADYIRRGWCFVTARLSATAAATSEGRDHSQSLVNPLVLGFPTQEAVYPLMLTGTAGQPTEILLYLFSKSKADAQARLPVLFAGENDLRFTSLANDIEPSGLFPAERFSARFRMRFQGRLAPEQMRSDLVLKRASDDSSYRPQIYTWSRDEYFRSRAPLPPPPLPPEPELHRAIKSGDLARVKAALGERSAGEIAKGQNATPLYVAAHAGKPEIVAFLISRGADANLPSHGLSPLHIAAGEGHKAVVEVLLDNGAESVRKDGVSPLSHAITSDKVEVARLLVERGADVNGGELSRAAIGGHKDLALLLISRGADVNGVHGGRSPLSMAAQWNRLEMVQLLVERGAIVNQSLGTLSGSPLKDAGGEEVKKFLSSKGAR